MRSPDERIAPLSQRAYVDTPENVRLSFRIAGPGTRVGAYIVDLLARIALLYAVGASLVAVLEPLQRSGATGALLVLAFAIEWGYGAGFETWWNGQTPGKRAFGLRVVKTEGYAIGFRDAALRNLLRAADFMPLFYGAGMVTAMTTRRMQRIGDLVAGTMVIREERGRGVAPLVGLDEYSAYPASSFAHRYRPSERTVETIESLFRRRLELSPARVDEVARVLAEPLARRLASPEARDDALERPSEFLFRILRGAREQPGAMAA